MLQDGSYVKIKGQTSRGRPKKWVVVSLEKYPKSVKIMHKQEVLELTMDKLEFYPFLKKTQRKIDTSHQTSFIFPSLNSSIAEEYPEDIHIGPYNNDYPEYE